MSYITLLVLSALCIIGVHSYLLLTQRDNRKWSISVHAADHKSAFMIYVIGHLLGGAFFGLFAYKYFYLAKDLKLIFWLSCAGILFEWIQAILPAKGKTDAPHSLAAYIMWALFLIVGVLSFFQLTLSPTQKILAAPLLLLSLMMVVYVHYNHKKLYLYQMWMTVLVFTALFIMTV